MAWSLPIYCILYSTGNRIGKTTLLFKSAKGGWWDRRGENEIDLIAEGEPDHKLDFFEIKRDVRGIRLPRQNMV